MNNNEIISIVNESLYLCTNKISDWLYNRLPKISDNWWKECVVDKLSFNQRMIVEEKGGSALSDLDLSALLRIADKNWFALHNVFYLSNKERENVRKMISVRNNWAHCSGSLPTNAEIVEDINIILSFLEQLAVGYKETEKIRQLMETLMNMPEENEPISNTDNYNIEGSKNNSNEITVMSTVDIIGQPGLKGLVTNIEKIGSITKYSVFVNGENKTFYDGQVVPAGNEPKYKNISLTELKSFLSAFAINNPSNSNLYSLNSARIDFVPYQFRPALKIIKSDEPRILIADSVGVGKTIEAGLILKELEARNNVDRVLIICPRPLVTERKWETEMKRFDEDFIAMSGSELRHAISETDRDGVWPSRYNKAIIPYSILDKRVYEGDENNIAGNHLGLFDLDPKPHFDLVIIDEAHHIRNGSMEKEKAFAYKCVKTFCDNADAVVMLTATPLQTSDDDLFTLLNVLRPDIVIDKETFSLMSKPNEFISKCSSIVRRADDNWQELALDELDNILSTQWGDNVISANPIFKSVINSLESKAITREDRVKLITDIESLHSFNYMINRTRRKDIQDFCIRRSHTVNSTFTEKQLELHSELLEFERKTLSILHDERNVPFMISTIRRQAASCIFGLAPHIRDIINKRFSQILDNPDIDEELLTWDKSSIGEILSENARYLLELADNLPNEDNKLTSLLEIIEQKQNEENNKIILFSTFRYTLAYLKVKLQNAGYRVEQIDGDVKDEQRRVIRERFFLPKENPDAYDILLFSEVGSEGLDYQFCNMMINYDLPWNPMRIEQRIGRIDRRGQQSEVVNIYNMITEGTVDAEIYNRCLLRIGVFEKSIGECEEILGEIGSQIEKIMNNSKLTEDEQRIKLEQMADNEVRKIQELNKLENEEKELFGIDISSQAISQEVQEAESPWLNPHNLQSLVEMYLCDKLGSGKYILGEGPGKTLRLSALSREAIRADYRKFTEIKPGIKHEWESYLKGGKPNHTITFDQEYAASDTSAFFITTTHPLVKQAATYYASNAPVCTSIFYSDDTISKGEYAFSVYAWSYTGMRGKFKLTVVCENDDLSEMFNDLVCYGRSMENGNMDYQSRWNELEKKHVLLWESSRDEAIENAKLSANSKKQSLENNYRHKRTIVEEAIRTAYDANVIRMKKAELENITEEYESKVRLIENQISQTDIHATLIANGMIYIN